MVDIAPTLLQLASGGAFDDDGRMDGNSFALQLLGLGDDGDNGSASDASEATAAIQRRDFTLIEYESIQNSPGQSNEEMGHRAATDSTNNTFRGIRWINSSLSPPVDLLCLLRPVSIYSDMISLSLCLSLCVCVCLSIYLFEGI